MNQTAAQLTLALPDAYVIAPPESPALLPDALRHLFERRFVVALEAAHFDPEVEQSLKPFTVLPILPIKPGTVWPKSRWMYFEGTAEGLDVFAGLIQRIESPLLCSHLYALSAGQLAVQWHDAFNDPIRVSRNLPRTAVLKFCSALGVAPPVELIE